MGINSKRAGLYDGSIKPAVPWLEIYNAQSATAEVAPVWNSIMFEGVTGELAIKTSDFDYRTDDIRGIIHVYTTGLYRIDLDLGFANPQDSHTVTTRLLVNGSEVVATRASATSSNEMQIHMSKIVYLRANDELTVQYQSDSDSTSFTSENHGRLRIEFIPCGGWNNNAGGNIVNRGIRR
jgi:hypothetical protein